MRNAARVLPDYVQKNGGSRYMPLKLKGVLFRHGIQQSEWAAAIIQRGGRNGGQGLSQPTATQILSWGIWPKLTPAHDIKAQTEAFLRGKGVADELIASAWEEDEEDHRGVATPKKEPRTSGAEFEFESDTHLPEVEMLTQQAKKHFSLFRDPFVDDVQGPEDVFLAGEQRYIREAMFQTAKHGGFLAVIGESGAGKSTLRRDLVERIQREQAPITVIQPASLDKTRLTAEHIADAIVGDISQEPVKRTREAKARHIQKLLTGSSRAGNSHVLIIEEAHDLSVQTLKYLKRFWELEDGFRKLLAIILIGQPELKNKLDERQNWEAREVIRRCEIAELMPLDRDLEAYLAMKLKRIGREVGQVFAPDAFDAIRARLTLTRRGTHQAVSMLYPLVVNNLVVKSMNLAAEIGAETISADVVKGV
jgi:type II secretory pathway predicted ATPase ExeA